MARFLLINYEYPPLGGGAGNATANMARELAALGGEVDVLTAAFPGLPRREQADGVTVHRVATLRRRRDRSSVVEMLAFLAASLAAAPWLAWRRRPDITVAFFGMPCGPAAWLVRALFGVPYVVSLRGGDVPGFFHEGIGPYHRLAGPVIGWLWRRATAVVANSGGLADLARRFAPDVPVSVVPNGVDTGVFRPLPGEAGPASGAPLRLLFVGRLVRQKGVECLLEALAGLVPPAVLTVVGDGPLRGELEARAAALGIAERVRFAGWLGRAELPAVYRDSDLFVLPSRDEGMPNVVLEAMASGLPVVATRIAGCVELVADGATGRLVPVDDSAALALALAEFAGDRALGRRMGAAGRALVEARYSWRAVAVAYARFGAVPGSD